jgi:hypothetical protein
MNKQIERAFEFREAVRERVPLLIGLMGPSGGGKTFSALRLATGIQRVTGGDIFVIDTEARRALHYADLFKFRHLEFVEPFGSLDYLAAIKSAVAQGAKTIVVDSMSHEHSGVGGYLDTHEVEVERMAGGDERKRDRVQIAGWIKPAQYRKQMIDGILHLNCNFVFCFRAKEKIKPQPGKEPLELGWMPIAGEELLFEMTINALLLPKANGVATWRSDLIGERLMMKLPERFAGLLPEGKAFDEEIGASLAQWARGEAIKDDLGDWPSRAETAARGGVASFRAFWRSVPKDIRGKLGSKLDSLKDIATRADSAVADDPFANETQGSGPAPGSGGEAPPPEAGAAGLSSREAPASAAVASQGAPETGAEDLGAGDAPKNGDGRPGPSNAALDREALRADLEHQGQNKAEEGLKELNRWLDEDLTPDEQALLSHKVTSAWAKRAREVDASKNVRGRR